MSPKLHKNSKRHAVSSWSRSPGCCGFRGVFWVRRFFSCFFFRFFFVFPFERTRPAASMWPPCLIYLSTSMEQKRTSTAHSTTPIATPMRCGLKSERKTFRSIGPLRCQLAFGFAASIRAKGAPCLSASPPCPHNIRHTSQWVYSWLRPPYREIRVRTISEIAGVARQKD